MAIVRSKFHPKTYHNAILNFVDNHVWSRIGTKAPVFAESLRWFSNYALFNLEIRALKNMFSFPSGFHVAGALVGGVIQGYDKCSAQKNLEENYPYISILIGMLNGALCCILQGVVGNNMPVFYGSTILSFLVASMISEQTMCPIEQFAFNKLSQFYGNEMLPIWKAPVEFTGLVATNWKNAFMNVEKIIDEAALVFGNVIKMPVTVIRTACEKVAEICSHNKEIKSCCLGEEKLKISSEDVSSDLPPVATSVAATSQFSHVKNSQKTSGCCSRA